MVKVLRISITIWTNQWNWSYKLHHYENLVSYYKFCFKNTYKIKYVTIIRNSATAMNRIGVKCSKIQWLSNDKANETHVMVDHKFYKHKKPHFFGNVDCHTLLFKSFFYSDFCSWRSKTSFDGTEFIKLGHNHGVCTKKVCCYRKNYQFSQFNYQKIFTLHNKLLTC